MEGLDLVNLTQTGLPQSYSKGIPNERVSCTTYGIAPRNQYLRGRLCDSKATSFAGMFVSLSSNDQILSQPEAGELALSKESIKDAARRFLRQPHTRATVLGAIVIVLLWVLAISGDRSSLALPVTVMGSGLLGWLAG